AGAFESFGGFLAQRVNATVDVGVRVLLVAIDRVDDLLRALGRGGAVEVHELVPMHLARQDREVSADALDVVWLRDARRDHLGVGGHYSNSFRAAVSFICPARLSSMCLRN